MQENNVPNNLEAQFEREFLAILRRLPTPKAAYPEFVAGLSQRDHDLFLLGLFLGQVGNAGLLGWVENGYRELAEAGVTQALARMQAAGLASAPKVQALLDRLTRLIAGDTPDEEGRFSEELLDAADGLEIEYFAFSDNFAREVHGYVLKAVA